MLDEKQYVRDGVKLNYAEGPDNGPCFLILPSFDDRWQASYTIIPQLRDHTHLYILDLRGRGASDRAPGKNTIVESVLDVKELIENVIGESCHIFGHSNGGWLGMWLAAEYPELVSSLIVGDSSLNIDELIEVGRTKDYMDGNLKFQRWAGRPVDELLPVFKERYPDRDEANVMESVMSYHTADPEIYDHWVNGLLDVYFDGYDSKKFLKNIQCQTLILQAENGMISYDEAMWARDINPDLKFKQLNGFNHGLGLRDGRESVVIGEIMNFLFST